MDSLRIVAVTVFLLLCAGTTLAQNNPPSSAQNLTQSTSSPVEVYVFGEQPVSTATEQTYGKKTSSFAPPPHRSIFSPAPFPDSTRCSIREEAKPTVFS